MIGRQLGPDRTWWDPIAAELDFWSRAPETRQVWEEAGRPAARAVGRLVRAVTQQEIRSPGRWW